MNWNTYTYIALFFSIIGLALAITGIVLAIQQSYTIKSSVDLKDSTGKVIDTVNVYGSPAWYSWALIIIGLFIMFTGIILITFW